MKEYFPTVLTALCAASMAPPALGQVQPEPYRGVLQKAGALVNGAADFQLRLFTSPGGSVQVGPTQDLSGVSVVDGQFTVPIDFGPGTFDGTDRYLEIAVRAPANTGNFVILTPRQRLDPVPHAHSIPGRDGHSLDAADGTPADSLFVNDAGGVGIGTTVPLGQFEVRSGSNSYLRVDSVHGDLHMNGGTDRVAGIYNDSTGFDARTDIIVNNWPQMVVNGGGGIGIGTLDPLRRFTVVDGGIFTARFESADPVLSTVEFHNTTSNANWEISIYGAQNPWGFIPGILAFGQSLSPLCIAPNSWVGVGTLIPDFRLELPNHSWEFGRARANAWTTYSSIRWKDNVLPIDRALDKVMQLRGVSFDWKPEHGGAHDLGFVAEEVGKVVPELVTWEADSRWAKGLAYDRVTALAVEAIKEQQRRIESLRGNAGLRGQVEDLMRRVAAIEAASDTASK